MTLKPSKQKEDGVRRGEEETGRIQEKKGNEHGNCCCLAFQCVPVVPVVILIKKKICETI